MSGLARSFDVVLLPIEGQVWLGLLVLLLIFWLALFRSFGVVSLPAVGQFWLGLSVSLLAISHRLARFGYVWLSLSNVSESIYFMNVSEFIYFISIVWCCVQ